MPVAAPYAVGLQAPYGGLLRPPKRQWVTYMEFALYMGVLVLSIVGPQITAPYGASLGSGEVSDSWKGAVYAAYALLMLLLVSAFAVRAKELWSVDSISFLAPIFLLYAAALAGNVSYVATEWAKKPSSDDATMPFQAIGQFFVVHLLAVGLLSLVVFLEPYRMQLWKQLATRTPGWVSVAVLLGFHAAGALLFLVFALSGAAARAFARWGTLISGSQVTTATTLRPDPAPLTSGGVVRWAKGYASDTLGGRTKDMGGCGGDAHAVFAAVALLEDRVGALTGARVRLSEQYLLRCLEDAGAPRLFGCADTVPASDFQQWFQRILSSLHKNAFTVEEGCVPFRLRSYPNVPAFLSEPPRFVVLLQQLFQAPARPWAWAAVAGVCLLAAYEVACMRTFGLCSQEARWYLHMAMGAIAWAWLVAMLVLTLLRGPVQIFTRRLDDRDLGAYFRRCAEKCDDGNAPARRYALHLPFVYRTDDAAAFHAAIAEQLEQAGPVVAPLYLPADFPTDGFYKAPYSATATTQDAQRFLNAPIVGSIEGFYIVRLPWGDQRGWALLPGYDVVPKEWVGKAEEASTNLCFYGTGVRVTLPDGSVVTQNAAGLSAYEERQGSNVTVKVQTIGGLEVAPLFPVEDAPLTAAPPQ